MWKPAIQNPGHLLMGKLLLRPKRLFVGVKAILLPNMILQTVRPILMGLLFGQAKRYTRKQSPIL